MAKIESSVIEVIHEAGDEKNKVQLRVVEWIIDGDKRYRFLENRQMFLHESGEWRLGKNKGISLEILGKIQENWKIIVKALSDQTKKEPF